MLDEMNDALVAAVRTVEDRFPESTVIDSQSVKANENGDPCGYDADKNTKAENVIL